MRKSGDLPPRPGEQVAIELNGDVKPVMAIVNGEPFFFTVQEALALASKLLISVEVFLARN